MTATVSASIDLSDLLSVTINSKQLEVILSTIFTRLDSLEKEKAAANSDSSDDKTKNNDAPPLPPQKDWTDTIAKLQADVEAERQRGDKQQEALNALEGARERLEEGAAKANKDIEVLKEGVADLDAKKADKKRDVDPIAEDVEDLKKKLADLAADNSAMAARLASLEGLVAAANPDAAKDKGLSTFTDTLNDVLGKLGNLEDRVGAAEKTAEKAAAKASDADDASAEAKRAADDLAKKIGDNNNNANNNNNNNNSNGDKGDLATRADLDALKKDLLSRIPPSTSSSATAPTTNTGKPDPNLLSSILSDIDGLKDAVRDIEKKARDNNTNNNNNSISRAIASPPSSLPPSSSPSPPSTSAAGPSAAAMADLEGRVAKLEKATVGLRTDLDEHQKGTDRRFATVKNDIDGIKDGLDNASREIKALGQECTHNTNDCKLLHDKKADKSDLADLLKQIQYLQQQVAAGSSKPSSSSPAGGGSAASPIPAPHKENNNNVGDLSHINKLLDALDGRVSGLAQDKAGKEAVGQLTRDLADVKDALKAIQSTLGKNSASVSSPTGNSGNGAGATAAYNNNNIDQLEKDVRELQRRLDDMEKWAKGELIEIRATVDHIHHGKADASIVANKAEREYVENAMEKLMREVENVLNATNAGLIDTLDKSLNILRDMIDGKATKQDINKLQGMMGNAANASTGAGGGVGEVPDGLASYKSYRCLGCNRTMDTMRPRPMGSTMNAFTSRVPPASGRNAPASSQGPRPSGTPLQQQQQQIAMSQSASAASSPATVGYITGTPSK